MKFLYRFSSFVAFAVVLSCLPCAFGQSATNIKATRAAQSVLNYAPSSLLAFALTSGHDLYNNNGKGGKGWQRRVRQWRLRKRRQWRWLRLQRC